MQRIHMGGSPMATPARPTLAYGFYLSTFWGMLTGRYSREYAEAITTVYERADYNASKWNILPFRSTYRLQDVETVMNVYGNLAADGKIPEYDDRDSKGQNTANKALIISTVAQASSQQPTFVALVLYELFWATQDRSIPSGCFLRPLTCKKNADVQSNAPAQGAGYGAALEGLVTNILLLAAAAGIVYIIVTKR